MNNSYQVYASSVNVNISHVLEYKNGLDICLIQLNVKVYFHLADWSLVTRGRSVEAIYTRFYKFLIVTEFPVSAGFSCPSEPSPADLICPSPTSTNNAWF